MPARSSTASGCVQSKPAQPEAAEPKPAQPGFDARPSGPQSILNARIPEAEARILVFAPTGRDAALIAGTLSADSLAVAFCPDDETLLKMLSEGAAAAIIAEEALSHAAIASLGRWIASQDTWSDMPFVVLTSHGMPSPSTARKARELEALGNVTFLERPARPETVLGSMRAAFRARLRQYQMRDRQEMLARVNADLEQFAHSASHDLKEPIRNIAIYSQLLSENYGGVLDGEGKQFLRFLISGAKQIEILVNDLLLYTQAASIVEETAEPSAATKPLEAALAALREAIRESRARVTYDPLPEVRIREVHLQQLFQNLIGNAIKYRREIPRVHVSAEGKDGHWVFAVKDNGIGFDPIYKEQVFGIFKRLHTWSEYSGTGMGLAICQRIVQRYRGRIWAASEVGKGSTFYFSIPK
jgi:signal transduction histidine kinase